MNPRMAIRILMMSPIYFQLTVVQRKALVLEYCRLMDHYRDMAGQ